MNKIFLLTNIKNDQDGEDNFLTSLLKKRFDVKLIDINKTKNIGKFNLLLIRNIWPVKKYNLKRILKKKFKLYNDLYSGSGDIRGKDYLVDLYKLGYKVIPTTKNIKELNTLPKSEKYIIKPINGGSSLGIKILNKDDLIKENPKNYIIQPLLKIKKEISFYFIDKKLQYTLYTSKDRWDLKYYKPNKYEINLANQFSNWNKLKYGIQRIDMCKTGDNSMLLMEIEDFCPFLSLKDINYKLRNKFLKNLIKSLQKAIIQ
ncbi:hypothetical protein HYU23_03260 [Candidatus Woesearchaeota archaeon]|nr:hypothetical protein [Candidatus Woesearchaeota archaeon]